MNSPNKKWRRALATISMLGLLSLIPTLLSAQLSIFRPKIGVPEFPLTNGTFNAEIEAAPGLAVNGWSALLANDLRNWTCAVQRVTYGRLVHCNSQTGYLLTIRTPAGIAPELFNLTVKHAAAGSAANRHCVKILRNYETNFYILHYADPQVEKEKATSANGAGGRHGSVQAIYWAVPAINLINPRFMFNTGDEVDNALEELYPKYLDAIATLNVPLLITRGNNDVGNFDNWKRDIGQPTYSITLGSFYVCMKDFESNASLTWFTNDYAGSFANTNITFRLFGQHYHTEDCSYAPLPGQYPDLMLVGHNHIYATLSVDPYYVLSSRKAWDYGACSIFEFLKNGRGWICPNKAIHGTRNKLLLYGNWGQPCHVTNSFLRSNNGSALANTTFITNGLDYDFWDGRVRFLMRKTDSSYTVSGGEKVAEYDYTTTNTAVLVQVNIRANSLTTLSVAPAVAPDRP